MVMGWQWGMQLSVKEGMHDDELNTTFRISHICQGPYNAPCTSRSPTPCVAASLAPYIDLMPNLQGILGELGTHLPDIVPKMSISVSSHQT